MLENYVKLYRAYKILESINRESKISEAYPFFNPYNFFEVYYSQIYDSYKRNPNMHNKGRLQTAWDIMVELLSLNRANTIRNKIITRYNQNTNR